MLGSWEDGAVPEMPPLIASFLLLLSSSRARESRQLRVDYVYYVWASEGDKTAKRGGCDHLGFLLELVESTKSTFVRERPQCLHSKRSLFCHRHGLQKSNC